MQKQLINIVGALVVALVLGLGIVLGAVPNISQSGKTHAEADRVAQTNDVYDVQVQSLRTQKKNIAELEANLAALRAEIPVRGLNDQVFELIVNAASNTTSVVESIGASEAEPWVDPVVEAVVADATPPPDPAVEDADASAETPAVETPVVAKVDDSKQTVPFTISVVAPNMTQAMAFVDALRNATRLVRVERVTLAQEAQVTPADDDESSELPSVKVTLTLRSLVLVEN